MTSSVSGGRHERLRKQVETAMRRGRRRAEIESLLDRLLEVAPEGSDSQLFACRHLAEMLIERDPWRAALLLRRVLATGRADDSTHAMLGLCHALLGNFRAAVGAYHRALREAPRNPWYHHNLGHLLDVALGSPSSALTHLRTAHEIEPLEDEITASFAHCLAGLGRIKEALSLATDALSASPRNSDHRALVEWIEQGAPRGGGPHGVSAAKRQERQGMRPLAEPNASVEALLERGMRAAGFSALHLERARALWTDYRDGARVRVSKPEVFAAAIEYAISIVQGLDGVTRAEIARRYGVASTSVGARWSKIRDALELRPGDPRYATS